MYEMQTYRFTNGSHAKREDGGCYMEVVSLLAGELHSDHPVCASPVITELAIWLNDSYGPDDDARQRCFEPIGPLRMIGTRATAEIEQQRAYMAADFAVRSVCPRLLAAAGLTDQAEKLRALPTVSDAASASAASAARYAASDAASAASCAARYAASAARYAARYAASDAASAASDAASAASDAASAARCAARYAASAARYAASDAASAASDAASAASDAASAARDLDEIRAELVSVIDRMIRLTEPQEIVPQVTRVLIAV